MLFTIKLKIMFTEEQNEAAHAKVKPGADFPNYIQAIKRLGICWLSRL